MPLLVPLLIPFAVVASALILLALTHTSNVWAKALLRVVAARKGGGLLAILTLPARLLAKVVLPGLNYVTHKVSVAASHYMHPLAAWLTAFAHRQELLTRATIDFANDIAIGIEHGFEVKVPREIRRRVAPWAKKAGGALILAGLTAAALRRFRHGIDRLLHEKIIPQVRHLQRLIEVTLPRELGRIRARARALEHELRNPSRAFLKRLAQRLWLLGLAGLMVKWLARRFPWLFCRKVKTVGNRICGMDQDLLNSLLLGTLALSGTFSLREFVRDAQALEDDAIASFKAIIRDF